MRQYEPDKVIDVRQTTKTLDELCEIARGGSPRPIKEFITDEADGINWIKISDATASTKYIFATKQKIKPDGVRRSRLVKDGDLLLSNSMSFGRPYIMRTTGCIHDGWLVLSDKSGLFDQDYLYHFLGSPNAYQQFDSRAAGSTVRNLNIDLVRTVNVPLPPLSEQKRIVVILDKAFEKIAAGVVHAEKNLANARKLFDSYLNKIFTHKGEGWELVKLSELATDITDGDHSPPPKSSFGIPFITISNIHKGTNQIDFTNTFSVPEDYFQRLKPNKKPRIGDVLYTVTGSFGIPVIVREDKKFCFQRHIGLIRPKDDVDSSWLYYLLMSPAVFRQALSGATGTAQKTVSLRVLRSIVVPRILLSEQKKSVHKLDEMSATTLRLEDIYQQKLIALAELKQSLLQKAFSGELTKEAIPTKKEAAA